MPCMRSSRSAPTCSSKESKARTKNASWLRSPIFSSLMKRRDGRWVEFQAAKFDDVTKKALVRDKSQRLNRPASEQESWVQAATLAGRADLSTSGIAAARHQERGWPSLRS